MMHIFYVHSYITYFVSLEVIKYRKLRVEQCVLLYGRGFRPKDNTLSLAEYDLPFTHHPVNSFAVKRKFWENWFKLRQFDAFVAKVSGGRQFHFYTNQTSIDFIRLFIKHNKCESFSILEEGLYSYYTLPKINTELCPPLGKPSLFFRIIHYLNFFGRLELRKIYLNPRYQSVFGISEQSFPGYPRRVVMPFPFRRVEEIEEGEEESVLVFDSFLDYGAVASDVFNNALGKAFAYFKKNGVKQVLVKYHPEQYASPLNIQKAREMIGIHQGNIQIQELARDLSLELMASDSSRSKLAFYIFLSSAGLYAAMCGRTAKSFAKFIADQDPKYEQRLKTTPEIFQELVQVIG